MSFGEYKIAAERAAAGLTACGVGAEAVVSWMLPTRIEALVLVAALSRLDAVQNPILPIYREREVSFITRQSRSDLLIVPDVWRDFDYAGLATSVAREQTGLRPLVIDQGLPEADAATLPPARRASPRARGARAGRAGNPGQPTMC